MMATVAARELADGEVVFVGIGLPNLACNLARATHAPNLVLIYESGAVGAVPERLPEQVDFVTSPGHRSGGVRRDGLRMPGAGPLRVITDKAILAADPEAGELFLAALYPGVTAAEVEASVGWPLEAGRDVGCVDPPAARDLELLRRVLDPKKLYLKG